MHCLFYFFAWFQIIYIHDLFCTGFTFYFNVVINNSFNFTFETDLLQDSINYSFLRIKIKLSESPALIKPLP